MALVAHLLLDSLVHAAHRWSYVLQSDRYSAEVISNAMRVRGFDLDWEAAVIPLSTALVSAMLICLRSREAKAIRAILLVSLCGLLMTACWLFLETYLTYR
jgi:hypothetical protein